MVEKAERQKKEMGESGVCVTQLKVTRGFPFILLPLSTLTWDAADSGLVLERWDTLLRWDRRGVPGDFSCTTLQGHTYMYASAAHEYELTARPAYIK